MSVKEILLGVDERTEGEYDMSDVVFVRKFVKTSEALTFRLSNKVVQVRFYDKTEIIISSQAKLLSFFESDGKEFTYELNKAISSDNIEMVRRLKYILLNILSNK